MVRNGQAAMACANRLKIRKWRQSFSFKVRAADEQWETDGCPKNKSRPGPAVPVITRLHLGEKEKS